ncbi:helix-turn-helix domain-containing protein [Streptomyces sp. CA-243310]
MKRAYKYRFYPTDAQAPLGWGGPW